MSRRGRRCISSGRTRSRTRWPGRRARAARVRRRPRSPPNRSFPSAGFPRLPQLSIWHPERAARQAKLDRGSLAQHERGSPRVCCIVCTHCRLARRIDAGGCGGDTGSFGEAIDICELQFSFGVWSPAQRPPGKPLTLLFLIFRAELESTGKFAARYLHRCTAIGVSALPPPRAAFPFRARF